MDAIDITLTPAIGAVAAGDWDATGAGANPFTTHRFLAALEDSGSVGEAAGWVPAHLVARRNGRVVGVAPNYVKAHSQGEYIFDHNWAEAWERAGGAYYPKLQCAVPFTPATGPRLIAPDPQVRLALLEALRRLVAQNDLSSAHVTFCTGAERAEGESAGWLGRTTHQFHWTRDPGWRDYEDFLAALSSRKRKALRRERREAQSFGGSIAALTGDAIRPEHWDAIWAFYQDTGARKWGRPYLTRSFFEALHDTMRDDCLLFFALRDGRPVAGALNFLGADAVYGRYWGCVEDIPSMHFELCYHRAIDWALAHGLARVEAGAQGEHKLARGYLPVATHSLHWIADAGFRRAVARHLEAENAALAEALARAADAGPFRHDGQGPA